ncbi:MAG: IS66 family transposase [Bacteroidia bacterium]|nr:IS66 family transposase [Bacteroidia bacterium]
MQKKGQNELITINKSEYDLLVFQVETLKYQLHKIQKMVYGAKSERRELIDPLQLSMDLGLAAPIPTPPQEKEEISYTRNKPQQKSQPARLPLPADLPRKIIDIEPEEDVTGLKRIGYEITEQLEMINAQFYVKQIRRAKYAKPDNSGVVIGQLPLLPFPKWSVGASVIAHILVSKYLDHLPLDRQLKMFKRYGMDVANSTIYDWVMKSIDMLRVLHDRQIQYNLSRSYLQNDETPIKVLDKEKKGSTHLGYFWVNYSPLEKVVVINYSKGRSAKFPIEFFKEYRGYLQTDGYGVYDMFSTREEITLVGCLAHARRYFIEASGNDKARSDYFVSKVQKLYQLEKELREANAKPDEVLKQRQLHAVPILNQIKDWLLANQKQVTPQSAIGKAIYYSLTRWDKLTRYTTDAILEIDNNLIENQIRPIALGRKNFLFCGNHDAAQRAAIIYSLLATCKQHEINPYEWLVDVFEKLPTRKVNQIDDLLPQNWKQLN